MARINLLPWREQLREQRKQQFIATLVGVLLLGAAVVFLADQAFNHMIDQQRARNNFIRQEITALDARIKEISELRKKRQELIDRTKVIQDLQGNRPIVSRVFDQLVRTIPDGVFFTSVKMTGKNVAIEGTAESNNLISSLMRNQDASDWLAAPNLAEVKTVEAREADGQELSKFRLSVQQTKPADEEQGQGARQ
ncbi:PilN domain-containing protein [Thiopseudomonas denitrificans]|uniref:Type IV pilus assembly protein PilN n=1 Tax=Thiopseudomonas denitrificans TaxID=1501432 RepID=A0A4R6TZ18_9GAMM|nr:PilN domain-containing protein [Thiopseudomonas denitrificans]TDQ35485.1 type IV pilus assembly protein PilN [Thiopseudomonas denitrificans]